MGNYKKLAGNSLLFFLANFGSKVLSFIMVPYYTYALTAEEYGIVDVLISTVSLITPLVTFGIGDIVTLYLVRKDYSREKIFSNAFFLLVLGNSLIYILFPIIYSIEIFTKYAFVFFLLILVQSFFGVLQSFARGDGKVVAFAVSGIMYTFVLVSLNLLFLTYFKLGIYGYLYSMLLAYFVCCLYLLQRIKAVKLIKFKEVDKKYIKAMMKLSLPILPTAILWWLMNLCDKYTILFFLSASANGLYTVAHKLPTILSTIYSVFQQAWQLSTMEMKNKEERSEMYSNLFEILSFLQIVATCGIIMMSKFLVVTFCESTYVESWRIIPLLLIGAIFNSFSGFFGSNYIPMGDTVTPLKITIVGSILNVILNVICVPLFGLQGAAFATLAGFAYMTIHKAWHTRNFTPLRINIKRFILSIGLISIQSCVTLFIGGISIYLSGILCFGLIVLMYRNIVDTVCQKLFGKFIKRKG